MGAATSVSAAREFAAAWAALAARSEELCRATDALLDPAEDRNAHLFAFAVSGHGCIEALGYGLFALGAAVRPENFPVETPRDRRNATLGATMRCWGETFHEEDLTRRLFWHLNSSEFGWWSEVRALLARRAPPPAREGEWWVHGALLDARGIRERAGWVRAVIEELLECADDFATRTLSVGADLSLPPSPRRQ